MGISKLNKKAISNKLKVYDILAAVLSVIVSAYLLYTDGLVTTTYWSLGFTFLAVVVAFINPAKKINEYMLKKQTGQF
ncbi:hypothetical protein L1267_17095 [Pseudoalteromonas sp. OFAV1]|jgi:hypothetical protein|uniref:hypothetical protein n=1 Tax=Pseudoalteromonas sp. OFAV1 TaxID=2908892 RepID=UPI001F1D3FF0|nr:hypothetical protein [Pseudoalteromonas sp. OFAV1]MCF2902095.1 hypothetical protein [Pseudoalteromonas sp. OFAV1]